MILTKVESLFDLPLILARKSQETIDHPTATAYASGRILHYIDRGDQELCVYAGLQYWKRSLQENTFYPCAIFLATSLEDGLLDVFFKEIHSGNLWKLVDQVVMGSGVKPGRFLSVAEATTASKKSLFEAITLLPTGSDLDYFKQIL